MSSMVTLDGEQVLSHMADAAFLIDSDDTVLIANETAQQLVETSSPEGSSLTELFAPKPRLLKAYESTTVTDPTDNSGESGPIENAIEAEVDGETRWLDLSMSALGGDSHHQKLLVARDVTEKRRHRQMLRERTAELEAKTVELENSRKQLAQKNERLDSFAGFISHDLRNPLALAKGYLKLARNTGNEEDFETLADALNRMETMIEDLLMVAREDKPITQTVPVDISSLAAKAWNTVDTGDATLTTDSSTIEADPDKLRNIFENLFRNAVEHGGNDVAVTVGALENSHGFFVADDGGGIPDAEKEKVLQQGYSSNGSGLGLAIVKTVAERHGWTVEVTDSDSGGARFEFHVAASSARQLP